MKQENILFYNLSCLLESLDPAVRGRGLCLLSPRWAGPVHFGVRTGSFIGSACPCEVPKFVTSQVTSAYTLLSAVKSTTLAGVSSEGRLGFRSGRSREAGETCKCLPPGKVWKSWRKLWTCSQTYPGLKSKKEASANLGSHTLYFLTNPVVSEEYKTRLFNVPTGTIH